MGEGSSTEGKVTTPRTTNTLTKLEENSSGFNLIELPRAARRGDDAGVEVVVQEESRKTFLSRSKIRVFDPDESRGAQNGLERPIGHKGRAGGRVSAGAAPVAAIEIRHPASIEARGGGAIKKERILRFEKTTKKDLNCKFLVQGALRQKN